MNNFIVELTIRSLILASLGLIVRYALIRSSAQARAKVLAFTMVGLAILPVAMLPIPKLQLVVGRIEVVEGVGSADVSSLAVASSPSLWSASGLAFVCLVASALLLIRLISSLIRFRSMELGLTPASPTLVERVKDLTSRARGVFFCPEGEPPMTWGMVKPKIALPLESEEWIEPQFRSVVLHEDAHIRRRDWAVSIGYRFVTAVYWFNPLVWMLQALFEQDSERAADDYVLAQGVDGPEYAERILEVARKLQPKSGRLPAVTMARTHRLKGRLGAILNVHTPRAPITGWKRTVVLGPLVCGAMAAGLIVPIKEEIKVKTPGPEMVASKSKLEASEPTIVGGDFGEPSSQPPQDTPDTPVDAKVSTNHPAVFVPNPQADISTNTSSISTNSSTIHNDSQTSSPNAPKSNDDPEDRRENQMDKESDMRDLQADINDAMRDANQSVAEAERESRQEIRRANDEAKKAVADGLREAQKEMEKAGLTGKDNKMAQASLKFAKGIADMSIKMAATSLSNFSLNDKSDPKNRDDKQKDKSKAEKHSEDKH